MKNSFMSFFRFLTKNKLYTFVTFTGFSVSLMFVLLLSVYVKVELSTDQFHEKKNRIYRLYSPPYSGFSARTGEYVKQKFPEVEAFTRVWTYTGNTIFRDNQQMRIKYMLADSSFFTMFSFKLLEGNPTEVFKTKNSAVLSKSLAYKIFGNESPQGESFSISGRTLNITEIIEDMPANTHFNSCDAIIPFEMLAEFWSNPELLTTDSNSSFGLYFLAKEGTELQWASLQCPSITFNIRKKK